MRDDPDETAKELRRIIEAHMTLAKHAAHGHTHIEMHCPACGKTSLMPLRLMSPEQLNLTLADYERQLRCDKCGMMLQQARFNRPARLKKPDVTNENANWPENVAER